MSPVRPAVHRVGLSFFEAQFRGSWGDPYSNQKIPISWPVGAPHQHLRACFIRSSDGGSELTIDNDIMMTCHVGYTQKDTFHANFGFARNLDHGGTGILPQRCLAQRGVHAGSPSPIHA